MALHMKCSEPRSLIMRQQACDYCRESPEEGGPFIGIQHAFGILCCNQHVPLAQRDCKAWRARNNRVGFWDAMKDPRVNAFFVALDTRFPVLRSSGDIDHGWKVLLPESCSPHDIGKKRNDEWMFTVEACDPSRDLQKAVAFEDYLRDDLASHFPEGIKELAQAAIDALDAGIYAEELQEWTELSNDPDSGLLPDVPQIKQVLHSSGVIYREFVPDAT